VGDRRVSGEVFSESEREVTVADAAQSNPQGQQQQSVQVDDTNLAPMYTNFCRVTGTPEEMIIDFGLNPQPVGIPTHPIPVNHRIITNFYTAKRMLRALELTIQRHEATFGVLETDVHFPTDLNLLFDAGRKCLDLVEKYQKAFGYDLPGWRKLEDWRRRYKAAERVASKTAFGGGKDKDKRVRAAVSDYLQVGRGLSAKVSASLLSLCDQEVDVRDWEVLA
jgi:hypothetical protein